MKTIDLIVGARPNFMKIAPIIDALVEAQKRGFNIDYRLIHSGQHYDRSMSGNFFEQLGIPEPAINLGAGSGTQAEQTAGIMIAYERVLSSKNSDLCLVVGDVTSTMACAITAQKLRVPVAHVEGGIRSGDWTMPEEINRIVTDAVTNWFFTTSEFANDNLRRSGVENNRIFFVGNTMIDTLLKNLPRLRQPAIWDQAKLMEKQYIVLTLHRPNNVDAPAILKQLLGTTIQCASSLPIIFPVHPRTAKILKNMDFYQNNLYTVEPLGYLEFNFLVKNALAVITDSGGVTEETTILNIPCMTFRDTTERPETISMGTNELIGTNPTAIKPHFDRLFSGKWKRSTIPPLWDGKASERIVHHLEELIY